MAPGLHTASNPSISSFGSNNSVQGLSSTNVSTRGLVPKEQHSTAGTAKREALLLRFHKFGRWTRVAGILSTVISGIFAIVMDIIMFYVIWKFYKTKDLATPDRPWGPWAKESKVWPTFMLAVAATVTTLLALAQLIALCCRAKRVENIFGISYQVLHVVAWIIVSVIYVAEKTKKDLWGWSCTDKAKAIQAELGSRVLNFDALCKIQGGSWAVSICEVVVKALISAVVYYYNREQESLRNVADDVGSTAFDQLAP